MDYVIITLDGQEVSRSRNLRGILRYANQNPVIQSHIFKNSDGTGTLDIVFNNGATVSTLFADYSVLKDWIEYRLKHNANFHGADYSYQ